MTDQQTKNIGDFCWVELCTPDIKNAKDFYQSIMSWKFDEIPMPEGGDYTMMKVDENPVAGAYQITEDMKSEGAVPHWASYILVDNVDEKTKRAKSLGAKVYKEPFDIADMGRMSILADPTGAVFYLWQARETPKNLSNKTPGNFGWNELATNDTEKAANFYKELFGWEANAEEVAPGKIYTTFINKGTPVAGMLALTEEWKGTPPHWGVYFSVDNIDNAIARAKKQAGRILYDPISIPEVGRFTAVLDPQGVRFSLIEFSS